MKSAANIDILPMAAVGLILVLIMMVISPLVVSKNSTPVTLPQTHTSERKVENDINITYTREGNLLVNDQPVRDLEELSVALERELVSDPYLLVVVRADTACLHSGVLDILSTAKAAGALRIACATKRFKEG
ncbi:MAG: biopolymer transporter ExbD [candidate division WOR-3 bacterium]